MYLCFKAIEISPVNRCDPSARYVIALVCNKVNVKSNGTCRDFQVFCLLRPDGCCFYAHMRILIAYMTLPCQDIKDRLILNAYGPLALISIKDFAALADYEFLFYDIGLVVSEEESLDAINIFI